MTRPYQRVPFRPPDPGVLTPDMTDAIRADLTVLPPVLNAGVVTQDALGASVLSAGRMRSGNIANGSDISLFADPTKYDGYLTAQNVIRNNTFVSSVFWNGINCSLSTSGSTLSGTSTGGLMTIEQDGVTSATPDPNKNPYIVVTPGHDYTFTVKISTSVTARAFTVAIKWLDISGALISTSTIASGTDTTAPTLSVGAGTAPAKSAYASPGINWSSTVVGEQHAISSPVFWDRTAWLNLGWSVTGANAYLISSSIQQSVVIGATGTDVGTTYLSSLALTLVSTASSAGNQATLTGPYTPYDSTRVYYCSANMQAVSSNQSPGTACQVQYFDANHSFITADSFLNLFNVFSLPTAATWTSVNSYQYGAVGSPGAANVANVKFAAPVWAWQVSTTSDTMSLAIPQMVSTGTVYGHLSPLSAIGSVFSGTLIGQTYTSSAYNTLQVLGLSQIYTPDSTRLLTVQVRLNGQFNAPNTSGYQSVSLALSFDNGNTYPFVSPLIGYTILTGGAATTVENEITATGLATGSILCRVSVIQGNLSGTFGTYSAGSLSWTVIPA